MERNIGEIFEYNREWYQCVNTGFSCADCDIKGDCSDITIGACSSSLRTDGKKVFFKKLEKVGESYIFCGKKLQRYKRFFSDIMLFREKNTSIRLFGEYIDIEIKQNQEDMEENKLNLNPFDLEKAKAGKPVCTRDGRKARIICFDAKDNRSIIALVESEIERKEIIVFYLDNGFYFNNEESQDDLMILPEKHEGWINIIKNKDMEYYTKGVFNSEEYARNNESNYPQSVVATVKIEWEE